MKERVYRLLLVGLVAGFLAGCGGVQAGGNAADAAVAEATASVADLGPEVSPDVVAQLNAAGDVVVIDVREDWEYAEGHIEGAILIPLGTLSERVDEIPTDQPVILVCRTDNRSGQAYSFLREQGLDNVHNMTGGMVAWQAEGHAIEK